MPAVAEAKEKPLYGPEGSSEGKVDPNTHKARANVRARHSSTAEQHKQLANTTNAMATRSLRQLPCRHIPSTSSTRKLAKPLPGLLFRNLN